MAQVAMASRTSRSPSPSRVSRYSTRGDLGVGGAGDDAVRLELAQSAGQGVSRNANAVVGMEEDRRIYARNIVAAVRAARPVRGVLSTSGYAIENGGGCRRGELGGILIGGLTDSGVSHAVIAPELFFENLLLPHVVDGARERVCWGIRYRPTSRSPGHRRRRGRTVRASRRFRCGRRRAIPGRHRSRTGRHRPAVRRAWELLVVRDPTSGLSMVDTTE